MSLLTFVALAGFLAVVGPSLVNIIVGEVGVILVEALIMMFVLRSNALAKTADETPDFERALNYSFIVNLASFSAGLVLVFVGYVL